MFFQIFLRNEFKIETHTAGKDGGGDFLRLGRRQNEHGVFGRLFERFQKGVERPRRKHVHFVHDVDFIAAVDGRILYLFAEIPHLVHAVVGRGVDLHHVQAVPRGKCLTGRACPARRAVYGVFAIDRAGEYLRDARLTRAARAAKQIGMPDAVFLYLIAQNFNDVFLAHHFVQRFGTKGAVKRKICHTVSSVLSV